MAKYILAALVLSVSLAGHASANPDAVVFQNGDVRISGPGNGLVFADGSLQLSAVGSFLTIQAVSATSVINFDNGVTSPAVQTCAQCPQGMVAVGGGGKQEAGGVGFVLMNGSYPTPDSTGWCVFWVASLQAAQTGINVKTWATCIKPSIQPAPQ
jgi:hypothetical protein